VKKYVDKQLTHLACIMDGNRRWAKTRGLLPWDGHKEGAHTIRRVILYSLKKGIKYLSLYTFSLENFKRSEVEKRYLFNILAKELKQELPFFLENDVAIHFVGDRSRFPGSLKSLCCEVERKTAGCTTLSLQLLFCYGGQQEIVAAVKDIVAEVKKGNIVDKDITSELVTSFLWTGPIPAPDLILRTGGMKRLSNFLLFQAAYSEFYFLDCMWPELTEEKLESVFNKFIQDKRNFGV